MAKYPKAEDHNIPPGIFDPRITPKIICIHTMASRIEDAEARFTGPEGVEAHFGVAMDGRVWQWRDTSLEADSQGAGNDRCISVETEDKGNPESRWTPEQFDALVDLLTWISDQHDIPLKLVKTPNDRGIGFHRQFREWNPNNHSCPGDTRLAQLKKELIPELKDPHMSAADVEALKKHINKKVGAVPDGGIQESLSNLAHGGTGRASLDSIAAQMKEPLKVDTKAIVAAIKSDAALIDAISNAVATKVAAHLRGGGPG
jgi:N-acetylmuramoyl-L-alanine amidase